MREVRFHRSQAAVQPVQGGVVLQQVGFWPGGARAAQEIAHSARRACQKQDWKAHKRRCVPAAVAPLERLPDADAPPSLAAFFGWDAIKTRVASIPGKGRGLVCKSDVRPGEVVACSDAYACVPASQRDGSSLCRRCLRPAAGAKRCSACHSAAFCSADCSRAFSAVHAGECAALRAVYDGS